MAKFLMKVSKDLAILAGKEKWGDVVTEILIGNISPKYRKILTLFPVIELGKYTGSVIDLRNPGHLTSGFYAIREYWKNIPETSEITIKYLEEFLDAVEVSLANIEKVKEKVKNEKKLQEEIRFNKQLATFLKEYEEDIDNAILNFDDVYEPVYFLKTNQQHEKLKPIYDIVIEECKLLSSSLRSAKKELEQEEERRKIAGNVILKQWAETHGSELLRERIAGKFEWIGLAEQEYAIAITCSSEEINFGLIRANHEPPICPTIKDRTTPTLEEIKALKNVLSKIDEKPATASLKWANYRTRGQRAEIEVITTCPTGRKIIYYYLIDNKDVIV